MKERTKAYSLLSPKRLEMQDISRDACRQQEEKRLQNPMIEEENDGMKDGNPNERDGNNLDAESNRKGVVGKSGTKIPITPKAQERIPNATYTYRIIGSIWQAFSSGCKSKDLSGKTKGKHDGSPFSLYHLIHLPFNNTA